ncbi:helix-turn-helix domain-containing protein [Fulvivirgaceae bacterium PWU20]|uniref:Helix-turn-helix domain-containing protein n=1 Tax=Chryseosolibacter indicus TaxID=2782351 RepID=A0ABS5VUW5_9BACT|nr:helix-turn-helix domain-containing protein [Chryseosolibacter indicus]
MTIGNIEKLYTPVQPTVKQYTDDVAYCEFSPDKSLQSVISCYWQLKTLKPVINSFNYRVVADGCIDIFFELDKPRENFVMGFCEKFTDFVLRGAFNYVGIRFFPTMFSQLFNLSAKDLSNQSEQLSAVVPEMAGFIQDNFDGSVDHNDIKKLLDAHFTDLVNKTTFNNDVRLYGAINIILEKKGVVDIEKDIDTGISTRQLRRLFEYYIGDTPKTFSKVVRFQNILKAKPSGESLKKDKLFFDAGYYDQAHFIKEFKDLYGVTPSKAFGR